MNRPTLTIAHQSGHWTCTPAELIEALHVLMFGHGADLVTITEVSPPKFRRVLRAWAKRHGLYLYHPGHAGANECAILSSHPITKVRQRQLTRLRLRIGRTAPTYLVSAHVQGWGWFSVLHTPAHTEGLRDTGKSAWFTRVYLSIVDTLQVVRLQTRRRWTILGDWNGELRSGRFRLLLERTFPRLHLLNPRTQRPTLENRVIDGGMTSLRTVDPFATIRTPLKGLDHHAVIATLGELR